MMEKKKGGFIMNKAVRAPKFHTIKTVAERYQVSDRTVQRWIKTGNLQAHRFGKSVRISDDDLLLMEAKARKSDEDL